MINNLNTEIQNTKNELAKVEKQAKEVDRIKNELNKLEQKIKVIANLEANRKASVKLLDDMTKMVVEKRAIPTDTPEGESSKPAKRLWFTRFEANGNTIIINGIALDNKTVADFMTRLEVSKLFTNVNLQMLKQQKVNRLNLKSFSITCNKVPLTK
jgi:type IV pilus assembly protein PilN